MRDTVVDGELGEVRRREPTSVKPSSGATAIARASLVRQRQPHEHRRARRRAASPRPVGHLCAALVGEMTAGLPDLHAVAAEVPRAARARGSRGRPHSSRAARPACLGRRCGPRSSTTISSASAIVDSRWAMMIVVRPRIASAQAARGCSASVVASTDAVASSRIRIRGSMSERARDRDAAGAGRPRA